MIREPDQKVWDSFWVQKQDMDKVYPSSPSVLKTIFSRFQVPGLSVLEVGAGTGRDSVELAKAGAHVTVLDFSPESLRIVGNLRSSLTPGCRVDLVRGNAFQAPFEDGCFDLVFHQGLAEHFRDPLPLLKENWRLLKPGGYCLCDVPQTVHLYTVIKHILIAFDRWFAGWETEFTMPQLQALMRDSGYTVEHCYGDWMRPGLLYRMARELGMKVGVEFPKYPFQGSRYQRWKDAFLDRLESVPLAHYTQLSIGVLGKKPL